MPGDSNSLNFSEALDRLQALLGQRVNIAVSASSGYGPGHVLQVSGVLAAGWPDPNVARENGVLDVVPFHLQDHQHSGLFLDESHFESARESSGVLHVCLGDIEIVVWRADDDPLTPR